MNPHDYDGFFSHLTGGLEPFPYQRRLGEHGLPELLEVPTGAGKTLGVLAAWLYRLNRHPDPHVRERTPRRLAYTLPMRVLVEQVADVAFELVARLEPHEKVGVHVVMGGEGRQANAWRATPDRPAIFVGTQDMLLSRALNRAYGESRFVAPIDFGMLNADTHWVFDEVQLMGAALPNSRQLEGMRRHFGTAAPCASTWMSATVDPTRLATVDLPDLPDPVTLEEDDRTGSLRTRLEGSRRVERLDIDARDKSYSSDLAAGILDVHRAETRTIVVLNTVRRATELYDALSKALPEDGPDLVLIHSRFRSQERRDHLDRAVHAPLPPTGRIVVTTQVLEAGVDVTSTSMITEAAPWSSIVQRAGRCNRDGMAQQARLLWLRPPSAAPYDDRDLDATAAALADLEGQSLTPGGLSSLQVHETQAEPAVLRRRDLLDLFDTAADLSGNEVDVSRFIRDVDEINVHVAWRALHGAVPAGDQEPPGRAELCPAPAGELRKDLNRRARTAWWFDPGNDGWARAVPDMVRPGRVYLLDAQEGGYDTDRGWMPRSRASVDPVAPDEPDPQTRLDDAVGSDHPTFSPQLWVTLHDHLRDAEQRCEQLVRSLQPLPGLHGEHLTAAIRAAALHDLGKAHPIFQQTMERSAGGAEPPGRGPWAKSGGMSVLHERRYFRHELVGAVLLLTEARHLLEAVQPRSRDLVVYLVAAHHGRVRLGIRSMPLEEAPPEPDRRYALGVWEGDEVPSVEVPDGHVPRTKLSLEAMELGGTSDGQPSWTSRALALRDDPALGPFRLAFLEALVRLADWQASAEPLVTTPDSDAPQEAAAAGGAT